MPPKRKKGMKIRKSKRKKGTVNGDLATKVKREKNEELEVSHSNRTRLTKVIKNKLLDVVQKTRINCDECSKKFRFNKSYLKHKYLEHSKLPGSVQCGQCWVCCPDQSTLQDHIRNIHEREIFECDKCNKQFVRHAHVLRHKAQSGCDGKPIDVYPCEICHAQFSRKDNLMVHLRLQHIVRKKYTCKQCPFHTSTFSKIIIHKQKVHTDKPMQYECDHCGKVTSSRAAICKHMEIHGEKKFACDVCGYSTHTVEVMRRHVLTHVDEKPHKCAECGDTFIQRAQLQRHMDKHFRNLCTLCDITFKTKQQIIRHMKKVHKQEQCFICPLKSCVKDSGKRFLSMAELDAHIKTHSEPRPFGCEVCKKKFRLEHDMRRHMTSHTLERPRRCMYCVAARAYVRGEQLVRHVRKAHPSVFREHLVHIRQVLGVKTGLERVKKSELMSVLQVLDAEAGRIIQEYGEGVLYGGMQENDDTITIEVPPAKSTEVSSPLMSEEELAESLNKLLVQLIDKDLLECFGWPHETVDTVLEKVIQHCGAKSADREKWTRVQCLRENAKHLFLYVIEDKTIAKMLYSHTIDQIVKHILTQVAEGDDDDGEEMAEEIVQNILDDEIVDDETVGDEIVDDENVEDEVIEEDGEDRKRFISL